MPDRAGGRGHGLCPHLFGAPAVRGRVPRVLAFFLYPELYGHFFGVSGSDHLSAAALLPAGYSGGARFRRAGYCAHSAGGPCEQAVDRGGARAPEPSGKADRGGFNGPDHDGLVPGARERGTCRSGFGASDSCAVVAGGAVSKEKAGLSPP